MEFGRTRFQIALVVGLIAMASPLAPGAPPTGSNDPDSLGAGLLATFSTLDAAHPIARRVVADLASDWGGEAPDARIPVDGFVARWSGSILIQSPGKHRFTARTDGTVTLRAAGRVGLEGAGAAIRSTPIELPPGLSVLEVEYRHHRGDARFALDWEGPGFGREPVPARVLHHARADARLHADAFEEGRRLADRYGCANCHAVLDLPSHPRLGPPLADAGIAIAPDWLADWLADPSRVRPGARMPAFGRGFGPAEIADLTTFLAGAVPTKHALAPTNEIKMALNVADPSRGRLLFRSLGCLACHQRGGSASSLVDLERKRAAAWVASYLVQVKSGRSRHRADFRLSADESAHLARYLVEGNPPGSRLPLGDPQRGRSLAERARCAACHEIAGLKAPPAALPLTANSRGEKGCLAKGPRSPFVPRFDLADADREALDEFISGLPKIPSPTSAQTLAEDTIRRRNCLGCHVRDGRGGNDLGSQVALLIGEDPALASLKGTLTPPNLTAVGDKLRPAFLADAVRGIAPTARPWLTVRMPAFAFEPSEPETIVAHLQRHDRMDGAFDSTSGPEDLNTRVFETGGRLIGQRGFGCVSCHVLAGRIPAGGEPETLGPDLALAHRRMTERYFRRWVANPQRIISGTPMPQFLQPIATNPGTLDEQLATVWQFLGNPRAAEFSTAGAREFLKRQGDRALVVNDMVLVAGAPGRPYTPRGLAIGLKNDHSLAFDADRLTWLAWWRGRFLSRTKSGRLWEWRPEGERLWTAPARPSPIVLLATDGAIVAPTEIRERFGTFKELEFEGSGVVLTYVLNGPGGAQVTVREHVVPSFNGWERRIEVTGVPKNLRAELVESPPQVAKTKNNPAHFSWTIGRARVLLQVEGEALTNGKIPGVPAARTFAMSRSEEGVYTARVRLSVDEVSE